MGPARRGRARWSPGSSTAGWALATGLWAACDLPPEPGDVPGEIRVLSVTPRGGELTRDGVVRLELDALVAPSSLQTSSALLASGDRELGARLAFDPVGRVLTLDPAARLLDPDIDYWLVVEGPRGFDGAELEPVSIPFRVLRATAGPAPVPPTLEEVQGALAPCAPCHAGPTAALGLDVTALERTAIGVSAVQTAGASLGRGLGGTLRIEPGHPERSYLLYKMLGEGPIVGAPMGAAESPDVPLPRETIALVSRWIAAGAPGDPSEQP